MGLSPDAGLGALAPADGLDGAQWADHEFGGAPLGAMAFACVRRKYWFKLMSEQSVDIQRVRV